MNFRKLLPVAVAAAFALPFAAQVSAAGDSIILAQSSSSGGDAGAPPSGSSSMGTSPATGGALSTRSAGEPKAPTADRSPSTGGTSSKHANGGSADFSAIDKNGDGMISRSEWDAYHRAGAASRARCPRVRRRAAAKPDNTTGTGLPAPRARATPRPAPSSGTGKAQ